MELEKFTIKDVVLGTEDLNPLTGSLLMKSFNYIETSISYNNDFMIKDYLTNKNTKLITKISSISKGDELLQYHLTWLNRKVVDILLVDANGIWTDEQLISFLTSSSDYFKEFGLFGVDSIDSIKRVMNLGISIKWVCITLNPTYFNLELIEFLKKCNIQIISEGVLGGRRMAQTNIEVYSLQFLLSFAAYYSDLVCISGHSVEEAMNDKSILEKSIDLPNTEEFKSVYQFTSSRMVKRSPLTPLPLYQYLVKDGMILKFRGPKDFYMPTMSIDDSLETIPEIISEKPDKVESYIWEQLEKIQIPSDCIPGSGEFEAYWRYLVISLISLMPGSIRYKHVYEKQGNFFLIIRKKRFGFGKKSKLPKVYLLAVSETKPIPVFKRISDENQSGILPD